MKTLRESLANSPIGLFDSGVGGLTILKKLQEELPNESFVYLGDTANLPYGEKSCESVLRYSIDNARFLQERQVKMIVIACNTATVHALEKLKHLFSIPIVGVVSPSIKAVIKASKGKKIGILGTTATIRSGCYEEELRSKLSGVILCSVAAPMLVPLIEENLLDHPATRLLLRDYLAPMQKAGMDTVLLACTHYPILSHLIAEEMGRDVILIDPAKECAEEVALQLDVHGIKRGETGLPEFQYFVSSDPERFRKTSAAFLPTPPHNVLRRL